MAFLCPGCHDEVDNGYRLGNAVFVFADREKRYLLWDVAKGIERPLIDRVLEAGSAAAEAGAVNPDTRRDSMTDLAAAPPASVKSSAAEGKRFLDADDEPLGSGVEVGQVVQPSAAEPFNLDGWCAEGMQLIYWGIALRDAKDEVRFRIGDWFNKGEHVLSDEAYGFLRGFEDVTVRQYSWVAACVAPDTRVAELSYTHHRFVAAEDPPQQKKWLAKALKENLSSKGLYRAIHGEKPRIKRWTLEELRIFATENQYIQSTNVVRFLNALEAK